MRSCWKAADGRIIERDRLHDTVEVYDPSGRRHLGEFDPWGGPAGKRRRSDALRGALTMIYRVVTYDRTSERMKGSLVVPPGVLAKVKRAAGFGPTDDGLGEYLLDETQIKQVAKILGFRPETDRFYYYVEPYDPPEDSGFQQELQTAR
jgi:hypothetical protein